MDLIIADRNFEAILTFSKNSFPLCSNYYTSQWFFCTKPLLWNCYYAKRNHVYCNNRIFLSNYFDWFISFNLQLLNRHFLIGVKERNYPTITSWNMLSQSEKVHTRRFHSKVDGGAPNKDKLERNRTYPWPTVNTAWYSAYRRWMEFWQPETGASLKIPVRIRHILLLLD